MKLKITSTMRMNIFKNALVKSDGEFEAWQEDEIDRFIKGDYISWLEDYSPKKHEVPVGTASTRNMMRAANESEPSNEPSTSRATFQSPRGSPSKKERTTDEYKQKNFVKRIVDAFEAKYKTSNESETAQEIPKSPEKNKSNAASMLESWKKKSRILSNPFKSNSSYSKLNNRNADECDESVLSSEERIFHTSWDNNRLIQRRLRELEKSNGSGKSKMISSAFGRQASGLELCSTFLRSSSDSSSPSNSFTRAEVMRKIDLFDSAKKFSADKTKTMRSVGPYITSSEETIFTPNDSLPTTCTLIDDSPKSGHNSMLPEIAHVNEPPKVIEAFPKKPIDVDWIPTTGTRLPQKKSIKKLLCSLTSGKFARKFSSEKNLREVPRESQDFGYRERSCSSISLTSLIPIADALRLQDSSYFEFNRRSDLKTFKPEKKSNEEQGSTSCDTHHSAENLKGTQPLSAVEPRKDVKLHFGLSYPPLSQAPQFVVPIIRTGWGLPTTSRVSKIPKNPFDASTKMDRVTKPNSSRMYYNFSDPSSVKIKNDLYEVEFRRSCNDHSSPDVYSSSSSESIHYDVPRRFLSKSENEIQCKSKSQLNRKEEPIYDIPRSQRIARPRSSIYDDVLSSKRKGNYVEAKTNLNTRSLAQCDLEFHHTRIYLNTQLQVSSLSRYLI